MNYKYCSVGDELGKKNKKMIFIILFHHPISVLF